MALRVLTCAALIAGVSLTGCSSTTDGNPRSGAQNPTEPTFPTTRPSRSSPTASPTPSGPTTTPPSGAQVLRPEGGYVFFETKSGQTRCQVSEAEVGCEAQFTAAPTVDGLPANGVRVTPDGAIEWVLGNLGDIPAVTLDYRTYAAEGWTIEAGEAGTRFTNDATGHGAFVAVEKVDSF